MAAALHAFQIVVAEVAAGVATGAVVVVPGLTGHLQGNGGACKSGGDGAGQTAVGEPLEQGGESAYSHADPNGEGIERAGIHVVALAGWLGRLVQVEGDGQPRHHEEQTHHGALALAACSLPPLPHHAQETEQQRQTVVHVASLVGQQVAGHLSGIAVGEQVVQGLQTGYPLAVLHLALALQVVLAAHEVPEEITPVHEMQLIRKQEAQILPLRGQIAFLLHTAHPGFVGLGVGARVHAWQPHVVFEYKAAAPTCLHIPCAGAVGAQTVDGGAFFLLGHIVVALGLVVHLTAVGGAVEQGMVAVLLAAQIAAQRKNVVGTVLVHGGMGGRTEQNDGIAAESYQQHRRAEKTGPGGASLRTVGTQRKQHKQRQIGDGQAGVDGQTQHIGEEQFGPAACLCHTGHYHIEYAQQHQHPGGEGCRTAAPVGLAALSVVYHEGHGGQTEQTE